MVEDPEFGVAAALELSVSDSSLRSARREVETELAAAEPELGLDESFDVAATIDAATVTDAALADTQAELETGLDPVTVDVEAREGGLTDPLLAGGAGVGVGAVLEEDVDPELVGGPGEQVGAGSPLLTTELLEEQTEVLEDIHDELEQGAVSGGGGLLGGAGAAGVAGRLAGLGGVGGGAGLGASLLFLNQASVAATGDGAFQAGSLPEDVTAEDLGPVEAQIAETFGSVDLGIGRPLQPLFSDIVETARSPADAGPEDTQTSTLGLEARRGAIPENIPVEQLPEDVRQDLGVADAEPGETIPTAALADELDGFTSGLDTLLADLSSVSQDFLTAGEELSTAVTALEDFPASLASALPNRPETADGELLPRSPVERSEGEPGARGSGRPPGRGRLAPGPNAGGTRDVGTGSQGTSTGRENRAAERKRQRSGDVNVDVTVNAEGVNEQEVERAIEEAKRDVKRELRRKLSGSGR